MKDYYKILNIPKNASIELIKKKYKRRALKYHPDKNNSSSSKKKFQLATEAYSILSDPYKRGRYDIEYEKKLNNKNLFSFNTNIIPNQNNSNYSSYSSYKTHINNNGNIYSTEKINTNINGKKNNYYKEYTIDKNGNKKIIKEEGNLHLLDLPNNKNLN